MPVNTSHLRSLPAEIAPLADAQVLLLAANQRTIDPDLFRRNLGIPMMSANASQKGNPMAIAAHANGLTRAVVGVTLFGTSDIVRLAARLSGRLGR